MNDCAKDHGRWEPSTAQRRCVARTAEAFGFHHLAVVGRGRRGALVRARQGAAWVARACFPSLSWVQMGALFGGRDHSTLIYSVQRAEIRRGHDPEFRAVIEALAEGREPPAAAVPAGEVEDLDPPAQLKPRNDFGNDTWNAQGLRSGSRKLLAALREHHPERCAA